MSQNINSTQIFYGLTMKPKRKKSRLKRNIKMLENSSEKIPYVQVR